MPLPRRARTWTVLALTFGVAAVCVRLGVWQTSRLSQRLAYNAVLGARLSDRTIPLGETSSDTAAGHYRRVHATGALRYDREIAWAPRMRRGSPGVNLLTPMRVAGSDTAVVVNRGWVYSADAKSVDFSRWREADSASVGGYTETWSQDCAVVSGAALPALCGDSATRLLRRLDRRAAERLLGVPVAPYIIMQTSDSTLHADSVPARVEEPILDEGPHRGYAFQWFGFATVAVVGGIALALSGRSR
jgi:surfeit locus 1 family protein